MAGTWEDQYAPPAPSNDAVVEYMAHLQGSGDTEFVQQPKECGTTGQSKRLEGFLLRRFHGSSPFGLRYKAHLENLGDTPWYYLNEFCGTRGEGLRLEAIWIEVVGPSLGKYDVYYRAHLQGTGWTGWLRNGQQCGTTGQSRRVEAIAVFMADKPVDA